MLRKNNRVNKKTIDLLFKEGRSIVSANLTFGFILTSAPTAARISFIVPKSVARLAVKRNFLRRRGNIVLEKYIKQFPLGLTGVFIFKKYQDDTSTLEHEIKNILDKIN